MFKTLNRSGQILLNCDPFELDRIRPDQVLDQIRFFPNPIRSDLFGALYISNLLNQSLEAWVDPINLTNESDIPKLKQMMPFVYDGHNK